MDAAAWRHDEENEALKGLLDAFGATFSLTDIATAYCKAGRNGPMAAEILIGTESRTSGSVSCNDASTGAMTNNEASQTSYGCSPKNSGQQNGKFTSSKQKWRPVSAGTVSSILGKDYVKSIPSANASIPHTKPLKLDSKELPMNVIWEEKKSSSSFKDKQLHKDMEDFLLKMLGDGFQLDRDVIRQVLDSCGYDIQKSMDKLLDGTAVNLCRKNKFFVEPANKVNGMHSTLNGASQNVNSSKGGSKIDSINGAESPCQLEERNYFQKEVLKALFSGPDSESERLGDIERRPMKPQIRSKALGQLVSEPLTDFAAEKKNDLIHSEQDNKYEEEEGGFHALRNAVKEYHDAMKEYYKSAVEAFAKDDHDRANKLLEQGQFFRDKAREADEESSQKIFETKSTKIKDEMLLDLHTYGATEAISLLRRHLSWLAGATFKHLRVVVESDEEDDSKGARRRRIIKLLEKESVSFTEEEGSSGTILVRLDHINHKSLSFAKKYRA